MNVINSYLVAASYDWDDFYRHLPDKKALGEYLHTTFGIPLSIQTFSEKFWEFLDAEYEAGKWKSFQILQITADSIKEIEPTDLKPSTRSMTIYTITTDDKDGHNCCVTFDKDYADQVAYEWCERHWLMDDGPMPDDWTEAYKIIGDGEDFLWYEIHEVDETPLMRSAKAQLGDLLEQVYQMQGMFDDEDGAIARAVRDAEAWPEISDEVDDEI